MNENDMKPEFETLLKMLTTQFPCRFEVEKDGVSLKAYLNGTERALIVRRDGTWDYK